MIAAITSSQRPFVDHPVISGVIEYADDSIIADVTAGVTRLMTVIMTRV